MSLSVWPRPRYRSSTLRPPGVDLDGRGLGEDPVRRVEDDLVQLRRQLRDRRDRALALPLAGRLDHRDAALVAPDRRRPERVVAEAVVAVAVGVDDDTDRQRRQRPQVIADLLSLAMADPGIDDQRRLVAEDDADVLVIELVARHEDAVADFGPGRHGRSVAVEAA
jgi:hypothetical protein